MRTPLLAVGVAVSCGAAFGAQDSLAALLERARKAVHPASTAPTSNPAAPGGAPKIVRFAGTSRFHDEDEKLLASASTDGNFALELHGVFEQTFALDGDSAWEIDAGGATWKLDLADLERRKLFFWVWNGHWIDGAPLDIGAIAESPANSTDAATTALSLRVKSGVVEARLELAKDSALPVRLSLPDASGQSVIEFAQWSTVGGLAFPHHVVQRDASGGETSFELGDELAAASSEHPFARREVEPADAHFASAVAAIETKLSSTQRLLAKAKVDDRDLGWFAVDTGSSSSVLSNGAATSLGLARFGRRSVATPGGTVESSYARGAKLSIGALSIDRPIFLVLADASLARAFGDGVVGVLGADFLRRAVVELDLAAPKLAVFDPSKYALEHANWAPLRFQRKRPHVAARCAGDHDGIFMLDTGAACDVLFFRPAVDAWKLLDGRDTHPIELAGAAGAEEAVEGPLDWFEFGGRRFAPIDALFGRRDRGALADRSVAGIVGSTLLARFTLVFDYPHSRIAFVARVH